MVFLYFITTTLTLSIAMIVVILALGGFGPDTTVDAAPVAVFLIFTGLVLLTALSREAKRS